MFLHFAVWCGNGSLWMDLSNLYLSNTRFLGPTTVSPQTASRSFHATCDICSSRPHLVHCMRAIWPKSWRGWMGQVWYHEWEIPQIFYLREAFQSQTNTEKMLHNKCR